MHTPQLRNTLPVLAVAVLLGAVVVFGSHRAAPPIAVAAQDDFAGLIDIGDGRRRIYFECQGTGSPHRSWLFSRWVRVRERLEVTGHLRRLVRRIRRHWPTTRITLRGDTHYGRPEVMDFCEQNDIDFVFGLSGNGTLDRAVEIVADDIRTRRALAQAPVLRGYAETMYRARQVTPVAGGVIEPSST
jgi:Transposase DDE domain group 1